MNNNAFRKQIDRYYQLLGEATQLYEKWAKQKGITYNTVLILCTLLSEQGRCTQKEIYEKWGIPKQTVHTILKDLEKKGYVTFTDMPSNRRQRIISLTYIGNKYANQIAKELYEQDFRVLEKMGLERMIVLNEHLSLYVKYYRETEQTNNI